MSDEDEWRRAVADMTEADRGRYDEPEVYDGTRI